MSPRRKKSSSARSGLGGNNNNSLERMKETHRHTISPPQNISMVKSELRRRCSRKGPSYTSLLAQFGSSVLLVRSIPFCILRSIHPFFSWLLRCGFFCSESRPEQRPRLANPYRLEWRASSRHHNILWPKSTSYASHNNGNNTFPLYSVITQGLNEFSPLALWTIIPKGWFFLSRRCIVAQREQCVKKKRRMSVVVSIKEGIQMGI